LQDSQFGRGSFHTKHTFEKAQMRSLKGAVKLLPCFMNRVPQIWQAYVLAGIAWHLANQRRACGLLFKWCSLANWLILWQPAVKWPSICSADSN